MTAPVIAVPATSAVHPVNTEFDANGIRLQALSLGRTHGLGVDALDRLGIVVTEMAVNVARHAGKGQIILRKVGEYAAGWIEVLALDKGPGIADMRRVMRGGESAVSAARVGRGLAGIKLIAELFDIYSHPGHGSAVVAHVGAATDRGPAAPGACSIFQECVGAVCVPLNGEEECGDAWAVELAPGRMAALLVDGLGHGPDAAVAALATMSVFRDRIVSAPEMILSAMHRALSDTRGAAASVTVIDRSRGTARFCGIGNVDGRVVSPENNRHLAPQPGIVGHMMPRAIPSEIPWLPVSRLVMHSDGVSARWRAESYPGLLARHPALLAGVLFRDCARARDDATVLVLRNPAARQE